MLRLCWIRRRFYRFPLNRHVSSSSSSSTNATESSSNNLKNPQHAPQPPPPSLPPQIIQNHLSPHPRATSLSRNSIFALSAALLSAIIASVAILSSGHHDDNNDRITTTIYSTVENAIYKSNESFRRVVHHVKQTGVAASVLWQSLSSVLSSANHEVRAGFELRVAALLADISAANAARRAAIVGAGGGKVVDWLLETVAFGNDGCGTQAEAARALAYLIADPDVSKDVLGRPRAVPNLLRFIFSCQPKSKKHSRRSSFDNSDSLKGRSMLVAAIMDVVTSNCDSLEKVCFKPSLPVNGETRDIADVIEVIEEGGMHFDEPQRDEDDDDGGRGMRGIGIKILEGTTVVGLSRTSGLMTLGDTGDVGVKSGRPTPRTLALLSKHDSSPSQANLSSAVVPGLWDDLHCQHVAVPFAAWALANWAMASGANRSHIQELDRDGHAVMAALMAPERSVKWHGSLVARLLLEDRDLPLNDSVSAWSSSLLSTVSQASQNDDIPLARVALSALLVSIERSPRAQEEVMDKGLQLMRDAAKRTTKHKEVQETLAKVLDMISTGDMRLSLEESQKWSGILLPWVFGKSSSDNTRSSAIKILSCILEEYGPYSITISQGWLAVMLNEILGPSKTASAKRGLQPKNDKVKTQIDQSNILFATQTANQLAGAVVNLAGKQLVTTTDADETFPLLDFLSLEPFTGPFKNLKRDTASKFDATDSALATLKGIKALTEVCSEDSTCQNKLSNFGILCLLRRFLLYDDYEKLAAMEAYDASRAVEAQKRTSDGPDESSDSDGNNPSSVRVPRTAHIRKHAARLLTVLSLLPEIQKAVIADEILCKWLEDCANGKIQGCNDLKTQSYARATLLNVFCNQQARSDSSNSDDGVPDSGIANRNRSCPRYDDMIFLINPELPHWKCPEDNDRDIVQRNKSSVGMIDFNSPSTHEIEASNVGDSSSSIAESQNSSQSVVPLLDIVFIHGLRGGPYKTWRISDDKYSTKSGLVEKIDQEAGKFGTFWPAEWLSADFPQARLFTLKYKVCLRMWRPHALGPPLDLKFLKSVLCSVHHINKHLTPNLHWLQSNLTQWSGASLPLQEVSTMLLEKLVAAGIGSRPVVFVTHSMGGLVVKQMLHKAKTENIDNFVKNTVGLVFYSCPHFGSKLADMPWRMGLVLRPAPTIGELRSGSPRLVELNDYIRHLHKKGVLEVLSFCETKVTPIVEGYGGWAFRMEIVPIESAYPGFGDLVVLESTDHINSCKPVNRTDPSYTEILEFLHKLRAHYT